MTARLSIVARLLLVLALLPLASCSRTSNGATDTGQSIELLNVSYDPTRELWRDLNATFIPQYEKTSGNRLTIKQSHGGSSSQARAVIDGLDAQVVTLALWPDIDAIRNAGLIDQKWEDRLANRSRPYSSTIVFVVRKGNPKAIKDWPDLARPDVAIITPSPKTSGNGKLSFLGAWGSVTSRGGSEDAAREFVADLYRNTPVLDSGARAATTTFAQKGIGDVHLTWENEAHLEVKEAGDALEIVYPPVSVLAEPYVAWVDANLRDPATAEAAKAYLAFLDTAEAQEIIAKNYYRPSHTDIQAKYADRFPAIDFFTIEDLGGDWPQVQAKFFAEGAIFDQIYAPAGK